MLEPYNRIASRITLLEAAQPASEFRVLSFPTFNSPLVFKSNPISKEYQENCHLGPKATIKSKGSKIQDSSVSDSVVPDNSPTRTIILNRHGERIDPVLPQYPNQASIWLKKRSEQVKFCHAYHLAGKCLASDCPYSHEFLAQDLVLVLRHQFRKQVCSEGAKCRLFGCYFGHHCPYPVCWTGKKCQFGPLHNIDRVKAQEIHETPP